MKQLTRVMVLAALAIFVLASCSSLSVMKRRYTKGYFVEHSGRMKKGDNATAKADSRHTATKKASVSQPVVYMPRVEAAAPVTPEPAVTARANAKPAGAVDAHKKNAFSHELALGMRHPVKSIQKATSLVRSAATSDDALSLLWVVIVVILVIYIIGLLMNNFGLPGGLIHILGVIALVLLILWLLRII